MILCSFLAIYNCPRYTPIKNLIDERISIEAMTEPGKYIILGLLYGLASIDDGYRKYYWIVMCSIYVLKEKSSVLLRLVSFGVVFEMWMGYVTVDTESGSAALYQKYEPNNKYINQIFLANQIVLVFLLQRELFWVINRKELEESEEREMEVRERRVSRISLKRRKTLETY